MPTEYCQPHSTIKQAQTAEEVLSCGTAQPSQELRVRRAANSSPPRPKEVCPALPDCRVRGQPRTSALPGAPASCRPHLVHFHGGALTPRPAGLFAATGASRPSDAPAALPSSSVRRAKRSRVRRRAGSPLLHGAKTQGTRGVGGWGAGE